MAETHESNETNRTGLWVVSGLLLAATAIGVYGYATFVTDENYLQEVYASFESRGAELDVDQCVDAVLEWRGECEAMKSLCDSNVERMTDACLRGQDRKQYCSQAVDLLSDSHYAAQECRKHGLERDQREEWKHCGRVYRAVDLHCKTTQPTAEGT